LFKHLGWKKGDGVGVIASLNYQLFDIGEDAPSCSGKEHMPSNNNVKKWESVKFST
jgi:hypothetical protein